VPYKYYLTFDIGASNGRSLIGIFNGKKLMVKEIHRFDNRPVFLTNTLYWDILRLYSEILYTIQKSVNEYKHFCSLGIDTWGLDFGFIDKNGRLLGNPIHYRDSKRNTIPDNFFHLIPKRDLFELTGIFITSSMSIFNMYSLKIEKASELLSAEKFLMIPDIFNYLLTGEIVNEFTNASCTALYDIRSRSWNEKIFNIIGIDADITETPVHPGEEIGKIQKNICSSLNIPPISVIVPATHDTASAEAGIPVSKNKKTWAFISIGTWCICGAEIDNPLINDRVFYSGFGNEGGAENKSYLAKNITGLWIIQQCRENWMRTNKRNLSWREINARISGAIPFQSFIDVDDPKFSQPSMNMPHVILDYLNHKGMNIPDTIGDVARCFFESLVMKFTMNIQKLEQIIGRKFEIIHLVGGGVKNNMLCQWTADCLGINVIAGPIEATGIGNILMQLKGKNEIHDNDEGREIVRRSFQVVHYEPKNTEKWQEAYDKYQKFVNRS
jgi:sugar (pentulose or hexulose) kinase